MDVYLQSPQCSKIQHDLYKRMKQIFIHLKGPIHFKEWFNLLFQFEQSIQTIEWYTRTKNKQLNVIKCICYSITFNENNILQY